MKSRFDPRVPLVPVSRRGFLGLAAAGVMLSGCQPEDESNLASAARGSNRQFFQDSVGWVEAGGAAAVIAFAGHRLSDKERAAVIEGRSVYPALGESDPSLELRLELTPGTDPKSLSISRETLDAIQITFWHFDDPPPVIRIAKDQLEQAVFGLSGDMKRGGWAIGTVRGQQIYVSIGGKESYAWNLSFQTSLI